MKRKKENGFGMVMIMVILTLASTSMTLFILTGGSNKLMFQTNDAYLHACQDNLKASALAWAEINAQQERTDKEIQFDITEMSIPRSELTVKIAILENQKTQIDVTSSCSKARNTLRRNYTYQIDELK